MAVIIEPSAEMDPRLARVRRAPSFSRDPLWYKDAVIYQMHVKSFFDANNDGIGDFAGLISKLDYVAELGVNAIWLLPFYPSPLLDDGYDIADYRGVHPDYGNLHDVKRFILRRRIHESQRVVEEHASGAIDLAMDIAGTTELESTVLSYGDKAEVIGPPALRRKIAEVLKRAVKRYEG